MGNKLYGKLFHIRGKVIRLYGKAFHLHGKAFHTEIFPLLTYYNTISRRKRGNEGNMFYTNHE